MGECTPWKYKKKKKKLEPQTGIPGTWYNSRYYSVRILCKDSLDDNMNIQRLLHFRTPSLSGSLCSYPGTSRAWYLAYRIISVPIIVILLRETAGVQEFLCSCCVWPYLSTPGTLGGRRCCPQDCLPRVRGVPSSTSTDPPTAVHLPYIPKPYLCFLLLLL